MSKEAEGWQDDFSGLEGKHQEPKGTLVSELSSE
jgi:hypothetical protein